MSGATARVRNSSAWMEREVALARSLVEQGAATIKPASHIAPGSHRHGTLAMTFWDFVESLPHPPTPAETGAALAGLHDRLTNCTLNLPFLNPVIEGMALLAREDIASAMPEDVRRLIERRSGEVSKALRKLTPTNRPLHGDTHYGNLLATPEGMLWSDFEDACSGPIEWDIACMIASSRVLGTGRAAKAELATYGRPVEPNLLDLMIKARTLQAIAWAFVGLDDPVENQRVRKRLAWLENH